MRGESEEKVARRCASKGEAAIRKRGGGDVIVLDWPVRVGDDERGEAGSVPTKCD